MHFNAFIVLHAVIRQGIVLILKIFGGDPLLIYYRPLGRGASNPDTGHHRTTALIAPSAYAQAKID